MTWHITLHISRYKQNGVRPYTDFFTIQVRPDEYVLNVIERIWAEQDRSLVFRHACHHAGCGACGMRINHRERLACITRIDSVTTDEGAIRIEPIRNFPLVSDLVVDMSTFYAGIEQTGFVPVRDADPLIDYQNQRQADEVVPATRFENCIECGLCVSACPIAGQNFAFLGPASLAAAARMVQEPRGEVDVGRIVDLIDSQQGLWRCHQAFECSEVCPMEVDPAGLIIAMRRRRIVQKVKRLFGAGG